MALKSVDKRMTESKQDVRPKIQVTVQISLHPMAAGIIIGLQRGEINLDKDSFRTIGLKACGEESAQKVAHHLQQLCQLGAIDFVGGRYTFPPMPGQIFPEKRKRK